MKSKINTDLLIKLLLNLQFEDEEIPNIDYPAINKIIQKINEFHLREDLSNLWLDLYEKSVDIIKFQEEFGNKYQDWQNQKKELKQIKSNTQITEFVKKYLGNDIQLGYRLGEITNKDINDLVDYRKPKVSINFQGKVSRLFNFKIISYNQLNLTLHLQFDSFKGNTFIVTAIFSIWFDKPSDINNLDMNYINEWYSCHILGLKLMSILENRNFQKLNLFKLNKLELERIKKFETGKPWPNYPETIITYVKKVLNANPIKIIEEIVDDLKNLHEELLDHKKDYIIDPNSWFDNLSKELSQFYKKGKELFINTSKLLDSEISFKEKRVKEETPGKSREKLSLETILLLYNKAWEKDVDNNKPRPEAGFRTRKNLYDEFLNKKTRDKKYEYIEPVSRGTFYSTFNKYHHELTNILERDPSKGKGGGDAYRIIKPEQLFQRSQGIIEDDDLNTYVLEIKENIHEGLVYYNEENYDIAIRIFKKILDSNNLNSIGMKSEYLGVLYNLGKSYMKDELFENAIEQFEIIHKLDNNKFDVRFRILICLYKLGKYREAEEFAQNLYENLNNCLDPYVSLYENHKEILYKENISFIYPDPEKIHPNLFKRDIFSKYVIRMNRYYYEINLFHLKPKYNDNWEIYQEEMREFEEMEYYIGINISYYRKLKLIQLNVRNYLIELYRKIITKEFHQDDKENDFFRVVDDRIKILHKFFLEGHLKSETLDNFLLYLIELSKIYYNKEKTLVSEITLKNFGKIDFKLKMGGFPPKSQFIPYFQYLAASALNAKNYDWAQKELHRSFNNPDLELELFCLELYVIKKIEFPKLEKEIKKKLSNFNPQEYNDVLTLINDWKYEIVFPQYSGIKELSLKVEKYLDIAEEHQLEDFKSIIVEYASEIQKEFNKFQNLKSKGRNKAFNAIFSKFSNEFKGIIKQKTIDYSIKPEKFNYKFFPLKLSDEVFSIFQDFHGETRVKVKLFNPEIINHVFNEIKLRIKKPNNCDKNLNNNTINTHKYKETDFRGNILYFDKYLDYFISDFLDCFKYNTDKLILRYTTDSEDLLKVYFKERFQDDINNPYFNISLEHNPQHKYYFIKIKKKGVR